MFIVGVVEDVRLRAIVRARAKADAGVVEVIIARATERTTEYTGVVVA